MNKVKNRSEFFSRGGGSSQPHPDKVKALISPFLKENGIKLEKSIGNGNMSSVFKAKRIKEGDNVCVKVVCVKDDVIHHKGNFVYYDRVARKEEAALKTLNAANRNVVKLYDVLTCPIEYRTIMDKKHNDFMVVFILEMLSPFSIGRDKADVMKYSKPIERLMKKYGKELFCSYLGVWFLKEVLSLSEHGILHRDAKTENVMLKKYVDNDISKLEFCFVDFGYSHISGFDEYSASRFDFLGTDEEGGGTKVYYPPSTDDKFSIKDEYFCCGCVISDALGLLRNSNFELRSNIQHSDISSEMKTALLALTEFDENKRDYKLALSIFENIIKKAGASKKEAKKYLVDSKSKSVEPTKKYTLEDAEKALIRRNVQKAIDILESDDIPRYLPQKRRLQGIAYFLNDENEKAIRCFESAEAVDNWAAYMKLVTDKKEKNALLERLFVRCKEDPILFPLVCYHIKENSYVGFETLKSEVDEQAIKVNPLKTDFNALLKIAVTAA